MIIVDNSILSVVATCETRAALRYALGLTAREESAPLRAGSAVHAALAVYLKGAPGEAALATLRREYEAWATEHVLGDRDRLAYENVARIVTRWLATHPRAALPFQTTPELVEVGFAVPLADDVIFVGRMDALARDASGGWFVVEHKTTGRIDETWRQSWQTSGQLTGYEWAARQHLAAPVVGAFVNGIELSRLPSDPARTCKEHGVKYAECGPLHAVSDIVVTRRDPHHLEAWRQTALQLARRYARIVERVPDVSAIGHAAQEGQFIGTCQRCEARDFCAFGRPVERAAVMFRHEPWEPYEHAMHGHGGTKDELAAGPYER